MVSSRAHAIRDGRLTIALSSRRFTMIVHLIAMAMVNASLHLNISRFTACATRIGSDPNVRSLVQPDWCTRLRTDFAPTTARFVVPASTESVCAWNSGLEALIAQFLLEVLARRTATEMVFVFGATVSALEDGAERLVKLNQRSLAPMIVTSEESVLEASAFA